MKSDLDQLLKENQVDALWVTGAGQHNPAMVYLTGGGHLTQADVIKCINSEALLCHAPMERDEAARTGLQTLNYNKFPLKERLKLAKGERIHLRRDRLNIWQGPGLWQNGGRQAILTAHQTARNAARVDL